MRIGFHMHSPHGFRLSLVGSTTTTKTIFSLSLLLRHQSIGDRALLYGFTAKPMQMRLNYERDVLFDFILTLPLAAAAPTLLSLFERVTPIRTIECHVLNTFSQINLCVDPESYHRVTANCQLPNITFSYFGRNKKPLHTHNHIAYLRR